MNDAYRTDGDSRPARVPCPVCSTPLVVGLLEIPEESGERVTLFTFDCPTGDYQGTFTRQDVTEIIAAEVIRRLR